MTKKIGKLWCGGIALTLVAAACAGKSLNDVGDVDGKSGAGASGDGGTNGNAGDPSGDGGSKPKGGKGNAGKPPMPEGGTGTAGSDNESGAGMTGVGGDSSGRCDSRVVALFTFDEPGLVSNMGTGPLRQWSKGPYDSTNTATGQIDATATPPTNPKNLAIMSLLTVDQVYGEPPASMRYTIPFSPSVGQERVNLVYPYAAYAAGKDAVDLSSAQLTARAKVAQAPNENCVISASAWTTGTDPNSGTTFNHIDGPVVALSTDEWVTIRMDLGTSSPATSVNQLGFLIRSTCTDPGTGGVGGGGAGGAGSDGAKTVVLIDEIETRCE